jgi:hypothetical protein
MYFVKELFMGLFGNLKKAVDAVKNASDVTKNALDAVKDAAQNLGGLQP